MTTAIQKNWTLIPGWYFDIVGFRVAFNLGGPKCNDYEFEW